jgi:hypothetical protein
MMWNSSYNDDQPRIVWITSKEQLLDKYPYEQMGLSMIFAKFEVYDHTCKKSIKMTASENKAKLWVEKKKATKKHAKCDIEIVTKDIQSEITYDIENIKGTEANYKLVNSLYERQRSNEIIYNHEALVVEKNINIILKVKKIALDKNLLTKKNEEMRLTKIELVNDIGDEVTVTLFNNNIVDEGLKEGNIVKLKDAQVNMYQEKPDGLNVPKWGSISIISGELPKHIVKNPEPVKKEETADVICEQDKCANIGQDRQFFCIKCDMQLCSVCIFEHKSGYSLSGKTCDNEILIGNRSENQL